MTLRQSPPRPAAQTPTPAPTPAPSPERITAVWLVRWSESPDDPLRVVLDHALLNRLDWRPGDRIAFEAIPLDRRARRGGLIIRRANPEEPAITLEAANYVPRPNHYTHPALPVGPDGPDIRWQFPGEWVATFFPHLYLDGGECYRELDRDWPLSDLLGQRDRITLSLDCSDLDFPLRRTDTAAPTLDVHLQPGLLHLMNWSPTTPLALESESGFDPFAQEDTLTIRETTPDQSNLVWDGAKFVVDLSPIWLDRFLPSHHDPAELDDALDQEAWVAIDEERRRFPDTLVVGFQDAEIGPGTLSFQVAHPEGSRELFGPR